MSGYARTMIDILRGTMTLTAIRDSTVLPSRLLRNVRYARVPTRDIASAVGNVRFLGILSARTMIFRYSVNLYESVLSQRRCIRRLVFAA